MQPHTTVTPNAGALSFLDKHIARLPVSAELLRFLFVGVLAYAVNQGALWLLYDALPLLPAKDTDAGFVFFTEPDVRLLIASILAVEIAIVFKFWAHEHWTFRERRQGGWIVARFLQFNASCILNPIIIVVTVNVLTPVFDVSPYLSNSIGAVAGFIVNWGFSAYVIWPHARGGSAGEARAA